MHPDDHAQPAPPEVLDGPIEAAAPEAAAEWRAFRDKYQPSLHCISDRRGLTIHARKTRIEFDAKSMQWIWLLGFAGWKAWRTHGPHLFWRWLTDQPIGAALRKEDSGYAGAEGDFEAILYVTRDIGKLDSADDIAWPERVPRPQSDNSGFDVEDRAAFDLQIIALAYMLLHEARHVRFYLEGDRPDPDREELDCDAFARDFILRGAAEYAVSTSQDPDQIVAKRAAGIALGAFALYDLTPTADRGGTANYPPVADRMAALYASIPLASDSWFWDFAASLLIALLVRHDRGTVVPASGGKALCLALIDDLRSKQK